MRLILYLALCTGLGAASFDFGALRWRSIGPNRGGRSQAAAGSNQRPLEYYFGAVGGGLWKTINGGVTWAPVTDGQLGSSSVGTVAVSESNPDIVYLGMGETELRGNIMQGDGIYGSTNAGKTWKHLGLKDTQSIARIRIHPTNPSILYVAALGHPYGANEERGVFRSTDGGATWKRILFRNNRSGAIDIALDKKNPSVLYASIWDVYRTPWTLSSGGPGSGLFKTTDGGDTWAEITRNPGLPKGIIGKITVTISGGDSNVLYALVEADDGGLFRSNDAGAHWTLVNEERKIRQRAFYFSRILADPVNPNTVYAMNVEFYRSTDGGKTFATLKTAHADHHDLWIAANDPNRMISANDGGGAISTDGAKTWTPQHFPTAQLYHVATTHELPYHVCGAQQDNTTVCVPSTRARNLHDPIAAPGDWFYAAGGGEAGYIAPDPKDPNIFYAGDQAGIITRYDRRTGDTRVINVYPMFFSGMPANALKERLQWTFPIVFSPVDPQMLFSSSQHLFRTTSEGQKWERISPDLTRNDPATLGDSGGPITKDQNGPEIYGTIFAIAPSRHDKNVIWTGSDDGLVFVTRDGGKNWSNVTPPGIGEFNRVSIIDASPHTPGGAYIAAKRFQMDDRAPYLFKTADYGKTWTKIVNGIPADDFVHAVREDTKRKGLLYAGTEHGIYLSYDDGASWQSLRLNLPDTQVSDIVVEENDLVIATHGRSMYILDDIASLRQMTAEIAAAPMHLFPTRHVLRGLTPAVVDYSLAAAGPVSLEILDDKNALIKRFDSQTGKVDRAAPASEEDEDAPAPNAATLTGSRGINRFVWDMRYPGPAIFPGVVLRGAVPGMGPLAPPGRYTVRLTANGATQSQPLVIERDPRLPGITDEDMREQFRLAMDISQKTSDAHEAIIRIRALRTILEDRAKTAPATAAKVSGILSKLNEIENDLYQVRNRSPRDTLNYPIKLNNQLAVLQQQVGTGNARPTDQDYSVFEELKAKLKVILDRFNQVTEADLKQLNTDLSKQGVPPVPLR